MKISYHHRTRSKDGHNVCIEEMIEAMRGIGREVIVMALAAMEKADFGSDGGMAAWLKRYMPHFIYELMELAYALLAYWRLPQAVREHRPDCLYECYNLSQPAGVWIKRHYQLPYLLEVTALLFDPEDKAGLVKAIQRLMQDPTLREWLTRKDTIAERGLTWHANSQRVTQLVGGLMLPLEESA